MNKEKFHLTNEGLEQYKSELEYLKEVKRPQVIQDLQDARAQGDLSENAEYDAARDAQRDVENRIKELENIIKNAVIIAHDGNDKVVNVGKRVTISYLDGPNAGKQITFSLVGTLEADPMAAEKKISNESPIGWAINGKSLGDKILVNVNGLEFHVQIIDVE